MTICSIELIGSHFNCMLTNSNVINNIKAEQNHQKEVFLKKNVTFVKNILQENHLHLQLISGNQ